MLMEDETRRVHYLQIKNFVDQIRRSTMLTPKQKNLLWQQARSGDLEGAVCGYEKLVSMKWGGAEWAARR